MINIQNKREMSNTIFIILSSVFIASLITCNLIANKFVEIDLGFRVFIVSAGILPYPCLLYTSPSPRD